MIERYSDHAANERTYLAWIRTALAFMGFGLLIERFDLFMRSIPMAADVRDLSFEATSAQAAGIVLIAFGALILGISSRRYLRFKREIEAADRRQFRSSRSDLVLVVIVAAIGLSMTAYVVGQLLVREWP